MARSHQARVRHSVLLALCSIVLSVSSVSAQTYRINSLALSSKFHIDPARLEQVKQALAQEKLRLSSNQPAVVRSPQVMLATIPQPLTARVAKRAGTRSVACAKNPAAAASKTIAVDPAVASVSAKEMDTSSTTSASSTRSVATEPHDLPSTRTSNVANSAKE